MFYSQRAYPHQHVPSGARLRALREFDSTMASGELASLLWKSIGTPAGTHTLYSPVVSGRIAAMAVNPSNTNTIYLGAAQGGVGGSSNAGTTWIPLTDSQSSLAIGSIALDPTNPTTVYAGTGEENFSGDSYYGAGILKSINGGTSWTHYCGPFCGPVGQDGHYGGGARIGGLAVDPADNQVLLAAVAFLLKDGIYRSTDGGQTWTPDNGTGANSLPLANAAKIELAIAPSSPTILYAGLANALDGSLLGMFKSTDGGSNWNQLAAAPDYCTPQCSYDNVIAVQPTNANVVFAGGAFSTTLMRSLDGGNTWSILQSAQNAGFLHADMHALAFTPNGNRLYLGNDGGAYVTSQVIAPNPTFTALNSTLSITQFYPGLSINPTSASVAIGGTQDNGTEIYSGVLTWNDVTCGDGGYTAIDLVLPTTMYAACSQIDIEKSTSSGAFGSWAESDFGIDFSDRVDFIPPMVMDPERTTTLYFGTYRVYQSTDGASTWTAISPDFTNGNTFWGVVTSIGVAPTDSNTVYAGTGDSNVQMTTNAGAGMSATWTNVTHGQLPPRVITQVAVDPKVSTTAYVTFSGFKGFGDNLGHIFKTTNGGGSWTDISGNLPNTPVNSIVINPASSAQMALGTDVGVFFTINGGITWSPLMSGLPRVAVLGLAYHPPSHTLRASTHGRGVWDLAVPAFH